jgi:hypothetical protein
VSFLSAEMRVSVLVARPFSGDVVGLDCDSMLQTHRATLGKQPLEAGLLRDEDRAKSGGETAKLFFP